MEREKGKKTLNKGLGQQMCIRPHAIGRGGWCATVVRECELPPTELCEYIELSCHVVKERWNRLLGNGVCDVI